MKKVKLYTQFTGKVLNEALTVKETLRNASDALTQTIPGKKLNKAYVKDYLKSLERIAKRNPREFVKDYSDFTINDYLEDIRYNMQNESVVAEMKNPRKVFDYSKLTFSQIQKLEDLYAKFTKGDKPEEVNEYGGSEFSKITSLQNFLTIDLDKFENGLKDSKHKATYKKARKKFMGVVSDVAWEHHKMYEGKQK